MSSKLSASGLPSPSQSKRSYLLPCIVFAVFCLVGLLNHELWRDELRAWVLVQQSGSLVDLFTQLNDEGHPALWYLCLYGLQRLSDSLLVMQLFHGAIATASIYLIHRYSPFSRLQKYLITFSYFFFYEYAVVSRGYSLGVLCLLLFCALLSHARHRLWGLAGVLALLANTTAYGLLLSFNLAIVLAWAWWQQRGWVKPVQQCWQGLGALGLVIGGWAIASFQVTRAMVANQLLEQPAVLVASATPMPIIPSPDDLSAAQRFIYSLIQIWKAYVPIPLLWQQNFWSTNFITNSPRLDLSDSLPLNLALGGLFSLALAALAVRALRTSRLVVVLYCLGTTTLLLFSYRFAWWTSLRHHGHLFLWLLVCFWLLPFLSGSVRTSGHHSEPDHAGSEAASERGLPGIKTLRAGKFLNGLLVLQCFAGIYLYGHDLALPFSAGEATANYIQSQQLDQLTLVGGDEIQASAVAGHLDQPLYFPEIRREGRTWSTKTVRETDPGRQWDAVAELAAKSSTDLLLVWSKQIEPDAFPLAQAGYELMELPSFKSGVIRDESFYLYRLSRKS